MTKLPLTALALLLGACSSQPSALSASAACDKLGDQTAATDRLLSSGDVYASQEAFEEVPVGRSGRGKKSVGADLYVHATEGNSSEYLQRVLVCHAANGRAVHPNDPFHPRSGRVAQVSVRSAGDSYAVRVVGENRAVSEEILGLARALTSSRVTIEQVADSRAGKDRPRL